MILFGFVFLVLISAVSGKSRNNTSPTVDKSSTDLLSKFHQSDYKYAFERTEVARYNSSFGEFHGRTFKYNRTTPLFNASFVLKVDLGYDMEVIVQAYKFANNEYRLFPLRFEVNVCALINEPAMGYNKLSKFGNIACPLIKGKHYYAYNFGPEEANLPPFVPSGSYMFEMQHLYHDEEIVVLKSYGTIHRPIVF